MNGQRPSPTSEELEPFENFLHRHVGTSDEDQAVMLKVLGYRDLDALIDAAVPGSVRDLGDSSCRQPHRNARSWANFAAWHRRMSSPNR